MELSVYKTDPVVVGTSIFSVLDTALPPLKEEDIVVVTSKIVSICEGDVKKAEPGMDKMELGKKESDWYIENEKTVRYHMAITIKDHVLIPNSGIDESNGNGFMIFWPKNPVASATSLWTHLKEKYQLKKLGIIITDSHTTPLRWGTTGIGIGWCGFEPLKNYIGTPDIFGKVLQVTKANLLDGLSAAAVTLMGEGNEQTPVALIRGMEHISFTDHPPTKEEIDELHIDIEDDIYAPILKNAQWKKNVLP